MSDTSTTVAKTSAEVAAQKPAVLSPNERFQMEVLKQYASNAGEIQVTNFQKKLMQNYFIKLDTILKDLEQKRMGKKEQYREKIPFTWEYVNMLKLSQDIVAHCMIGLDPCQKNHINLIPYANSKTGRYDIGFIIGYVGLFLRAKKYGYDVPDDIIVEVVYSNDTFKPIKRDKNNSEESYEFEVSNPFDRGVIVGGFYFFNYGDTPSKNKLRIFDMSAIEKRRPDKASPEFWGGEKDEYKDGAKTGKKIAVEGWFDEMVYKTISRAAHDAIPIDSEKIDEHFLQVIQAENESYALPAKTDEIQNQIKEKANTKSMTFEDAESVDVTPRQIEGKPADPVPDPSVQPEKQKMPQSTQFEQAREPQKKDGKLLF